MLSFLSVLKAQTPNRSESKPLLDSVSMVKRIEELEEELNSRANLQNLVQNLRQETVDLKQDTLRLYGEKVKLQGECDKLRKENEQLSVFKGALLAQLSDNVVERWLNMPYCQIDSVAFSDTLALFDKYKNDNTKVGMAYTQMKTLGENLDLYRRGKRAVNSPYDAKTVKELVQPMKILSESVKSQGNKKNLDEISEIYEQLYYYKGRLMVFRNDIISDIVESDIERWKKVGKPAEDAWILLESELPKPELESSISKIPWLREQYRAYYEQLKKDVYGPNPARDIIMNLVP